MRGHNKKRDYKYKIYSRGFDFLFKNERQRDQRVKFLAGQFTILVGPGHYFEP